MNAQPPAFWRASALYHRAFGIPSKEVHWRTIGERWITGVSADMRTIVSVSAQELTTKQEVTARREITKSRQADLAIDLVHRGLNL
jgi:hypothetical protein